MKPIQIDLVAEINEAFRRPWCSRGSANITPE